MRRHIVLTAAAALVLSAIPRGASAEGPFWSSPLALGPHDATAIAAREGLVLAGGMPNHFDAHPLDGGGVTPVDGPRVPGLFRSTDSGRTWSLARRVGAGGDLEDITSPPNTLVVVPSGGDAYATYGAAVWRSSDNGATWRQVGEVGGHVTTMDVLGDGRVVAGLLGGGLRVSADRGVTWTALGTGLPPARVNEVDVMSTGTLLVATDSGLYRSADGGATFSQVTSGIPEPSAVAYGVANEGSSAILLAMEGRNAGTSIYTSTNDGASFQPRPIAFASGAFPRTYRGAVEASVQGSLYVFYLGTTGGLFRTGNAGLSTFTWERVDPEPGYREVRDVALGEDVDPHPSVRSHVIYATVNRASPVAVTSTEARMLAPGWFDQLEGGRVCGGMVSRPDGALFAACGRHIFRSDDGGGNWAAVGKGLPYIHPIGDTPYFPLSVGPDGALWVSGFDRGLYRSNAAVTSWSKVPIPAASVGLVTPHPSNGQVVFAAGLLTNGDTEVLWRTADGGTTWRPVLDVRNNIYSVDISPSVPDRVLVATLGEGGWLSEDAGVTWTKVTGLPDTSLYGAYFSDADPQIAWAIGDGAESAPSIYRSENAGRNWTELGPVTLNGRPKFAFDITPSPWDPDTLYVPGIDGDLVVTRDAGATYQLLDGGLPKDSCTICDNVDNLTFDSRTRGLMYLTAGILDPNNGPQSKWVYKGFDAAA